ncbi:hypothetical protein V2G26_006681 [Clonostachys chloroleuca]
MDFSTQARSAVCGVWVCFRRCHQEQHEERVVCLDESRQSSNYEAHTSLSRDVCDGLLLGFPKGGKVTSELETSGGNEVTKAFLVWPINWPPPQQFVRPFHLPR